MRLLVTLDRLDGAAVARGLVAAGLPEPDVHDPAGSLGAAFDVRLRTAFAVVAGEPVLDRDTIDGRVTGEIAVRARQAGVPCHAIVGADRLDLFGRRILDLQHVLEARTEDELEAAGVRLGRLLMTDVMPD